MIAPTLSDWRDESLAGGREALKNQRPDSQTEEVARLQVKIGDELKIDKVMLVKKTRRLEGHFPFRHGRDELSRTGKPAGRFTQHQESRFRGA